MSKVTTTFEAVDTGMVATINKIERETKSMKDTTEKVEKSINLSFASMAKAGAGLAIGIGLVKAAFSAVSGAVQNFGDALDMGGRLSDLSARTGETAGNLLLLERSFENSGVGADKVGTSINKLQKFMSDAEAGTKKNIEVINQLGLSYDMLVQMSPTEQLQAIADKISGISSPTERAAAAMNIFGKSGGALLPMLQNFSGEMENAQSELGSLTRIMDEKNAVFDTVSDKIEVIKGKFTEFAAGLLSKVTPALELFTTALSRIDAAAIGEKLADAFLGGQKAMEGFGAALEAIKIGEFSMAWKITFKSIELQVKETFNQIYLYAVSTVEGIQAFIKSIFGPGSALISIVTSSFEIIANKMNVIISKGLRAILGGIPGVTAAIDENLKFFESSIDSSQNKIKNGFSDLIPQLKDAGSAFGEAFDEKFKTTKPLIDTAAASLELSGMKQEVALKSATKAAEGLNKELSLFKDFGKGAPNVLEPMEESAKKISLEMRKTGDDLKGIKSDVMEISMIQKLQDELKTAKLDQKFGGDELKGDFKKQLEQGKFKQAEKTIEKIKQKELESFVKTNDDGTFKNQSIADIAKEAGIDTFGKSKKELIEELAKKKQDAMKGIIKKGGEKKGDKQPAKPKEDTLIDIVKMIKEIVGKIEPKLPTHALAL